jgi:DNA primase
MGVVDQIKERLDIVEVVSAYVPLQKSGRNYKALCPFHAEKTPSFVVFPESQHWHCFGACGEGGDLFTFVMKQEGWDFRTALEELARQAGVELRPRTPLQERAEEEADRLRELLQAAAQYYRHLLRHAPEAKMARDYVARRGLSDETAERFLLGYSPSGWDRIRNYLAGEGYATDEIAKAGLLVQREDTGAVYDRFRERLMIPIRDGKGQVIGFGARTLDPEGVPKYLNSPQTPLFDKGRTLFGLDLARQSIRRQDQAVLVEGYMDVMQAHQAGFANVVAQMGTALTESQLRQLERYTRHLVLALDPDAAGVQATLRGVEVARDTLSDEWEPVFNPRGLVGYEARLGAEIRVLRLPRGQDPDDLIRQDPAQWSQLVDGALPVVDFYLEILRQDLDPEDTKAKAQIVEALMPILRMVANPVERDDYAQKIARALRVDARAVMARLRTAEGPVRSPKQNAGPAYAQPLEQPQADLESHCLSMVLRRPVLLGQINAVLASRQLEPMRGKDFGDPGVRAIFDAWEALMGNEGLAHMQILLAELPLDLQTKLESLLATDDETLADEQLVRDIVITLLRLRERNLKRFGRELRFLTLEAQDEGDLRAEQYSSALRTYSQTLLRTQQALADRWSS